MEVIDNYLSEESFREVESLMRSTRISWIHHPSTALTKNYSEIKVEPDGSYDYKSAPLSQNLEDLDDIQFVCPFYDSHQWINDPKPIAPLTMRIGEVSWIRIKANLLPHASKIFAKGGEDGWHQDTPFLNATTSIFYINTNNGFTEFKDGTKVDSVANRIVNFPSSMMHRGTSCTDSPVRIVINLNYLKQSAVGHGRWFESKR